MQMTVEPERTNMVTNKRVLIVDDDTSILRFFSLILRGKGYATDTAETGQEALAKLSSQSYDVVLIDVVLPDTNGLNLLTSIPSTTRKIVITGSVSDENHKRANTGGAHAYLLKPIKPAVLLQTIANELH